MVFNNTIVTIIFHYQILRNGLQKGLRMRRRFFSLMEAELANISIHIAKVALIAAIALTLSSCQLLEGAVEQNALNWAVSNYSGACACPFSTDALGALCGTQSAYSLGVAEAPICYLSEVTFDLITKYLASS